MANSIIDDFNNLLLDLVRNIADICPSSIIGANVKDIERELKNDANRNKFIDIFVAKVLQYKSEIDNGDENFFLNKTYENEFGSNGMLSRVFEFKSIWTKLNNTNKALVKQYMQLLCELAQNYFIEVYQ